MATASTSANDLTRQQLDELDALLQRMLSQPGNSADPVPPPIPATTLAAFAPPLPPPGPQARADTPELRAEPANRPSPMPTPAPRLFAPPVEEQATFVATPLPPKANPPASAPQLPPAVEVAPPREVPPPPGREVAPQVPSPPPREPEPAALPMATEFAFAPEIPTAPPAEPVPMLLAPMVLFNRVLNATLGMFGPPGRVLRSGFVKNILGLAGLGLIAYTGAKVAQVHGWITLPVTLPWPM